MSSGARHQGGHAHDHHSGTDLPTVHCPNLFRTFVLSSTVSLTDQRVELDKFYVAPNKAEAEIAQGSRYNSFDGPPGSVLALVPGYLLLSVLRI